MLLCCLWSLLFSGSVWLWIFVRRLLSATCCVDAFVSDNGRKFIRTFFVIGLYRMIFKNLTAFHYCITFQEYNNSYAEACVGCNFRIEMYVTVYLMSKTTSTYPRIETRAHNAIEIGQFHVVNVFVVIAVFCVYDLSILYSRVCSLDRRIRLFTNLYVYSERIFPRRLYDLHVKRHSHILQSVTPKFGAPNSSDARPNKRGHQGLYDKFETG